MDDKKLKDLAMVIPSSLDRIESVEQLSEQAANAIGLKEEEKDSLAIAVTEAVNNAILHGNKENKNKTVSIKFTFETNRVIVTIKDQGGGFNPENVSDPLAPENLLKESGRGIFILSSLMDKVDYEFGEEGTALRMVKEKK